MRTPEYRTCSADKLELRGKPGAGAVLSGYPIVYNVRSVLIGGWFYEQVLPGAADDSIAGDDIKFCYNHEALMARSVPAAEHYTLRLTPDDHGVAAEADIPDTQVARDVWTLVDRGDISGMSFAFRSLGEDETWWSEAEDGIGLRSLKRMKLFDTAVVDDPAYSDTEVWAEGALRSIAQHTRRPLADLRAAAERREFRSIWTPREASPAPDDEPVSPAPAAAPARSLMAARLRLLDIGVSAHDIASDRSDA